MEFLTPGEKLKKTRSELNIEQKVLEKAGISRNFISMVENNKRNLSKETAEKIAKVFNEKAKKDGTEFRIDGAYLISSQKEDARKYCQNKLKSAKALEELEGIKEIVDKYNLEELSPELSLIKSDILFDSLEYDKAFFSYMETIQIYSRSGNHLKDAYIFNRLGRCKNNKLQVVEALSYFMKAYECALDNNDAYIRKIAMYNIAFAYRALKNYDEAIYFLNKYIDLSSPNESFEDYARGIILKGTCYIDQGEYNKAIKLYSDIVDLFTDPYDCYLGYLYNNLGEIYQDMGNLRKALECFDKAHKIREKSDRPNLSHTYIGKAEVFICKKSYDEAEKLVYQGIELAKEYKDNEYLFKGYDKLEAIYMETGDKEKLKNIYNTMLKALDYDKNRELALKVLIKLSVFNIDNGFLCEVRNNLAEASKILSN